MTPRLAMVLVASIATATYTIWEEGSPCQNDFPECCQDLICVAGVAGWPKDDWWLYHKQNATKHLRSKGLERKYQSTWTYCYIDHQWRHPPYDRQISCTLTMKILRISKTPHGSFKKMQEKRLTMMTFKKTKLIKDIWENCMWLRRILPWQQRSS